MLRYNNVHVPCEQRDTTGAHLHKRQRGVPWELDDAAHARQGGAAAAVACNKHELAWSNEGNGSNSERAVVRNDDSGIGRKASAAELAVKQRAAEGARARTSGCKRSCQQKTEPERQQRKKNAARELLAALQVS